MPQTHWICTTKQCNIRKSYFFFHIYRIKNRLFILCPLCSVSVFFVSIKRSKSKQTQPLLLFLFFFIFFFSFWGFFLHWHFVHEHAAWTATLSQTVQKQTVHDPNVTPTKTNRLRNFWWKVDNTDKNTHDTRPRRTTGRASLPRTEQGDCGLSFSG